VLHAITTLLYSFVIDAGKLFFGGSVLIGIKCTERARMIPMWVGEVPMKVTKRRLNICCQAAIKTIHIPNRKQPKFLIEPLELKRGSSILLPPINFSKLSLYPLAALLEWLSVATICIC